MTAFLALQSSTITSSSSSRSSSRSTRITMTTMMMPLQRILLVCLLLTRVSYGQDPNLVPTFSAAPSVAPNSTWYPLFNITLAPSNTTTLPPGAATFDPVASLAPTPSAGIPSNGTDLTPAPAAAATEIPDSTFIPATSTPSFSPVSVTAVPTTSAPVVQTAAPSTAAPSIGVSPPPLSLAPVFPGIPATVAPSDDPSDSPSRLPTPIPGGNGTAMPSAVNVTGTAMPGTLAPTTVGSDAPSDEPSVGTNGTTAPSLTMQPTAPPTTLDIPTIAPTANGTLDSPTLSPIRGKTVTETFTGVTMTLRGVGAMDVSSILNWKTTTESFYEGLYNTEDSNILVGRLRNIRRRVRKLQQSQGVENFKTNITYRGDAPTDSDNTLRYDQTVTYDQTTTENVPTAQELIQDPFKNDDLNREYTADLRGSDPIFSQLQEGVVLTAPAPSPTGTPDEIVSPVDDGRRLSPGAIAGIVLGCVAVVGIVGYFIMNSKSGDGGGGGGGDYLPTTNVPPQTLSMDDQGEEVSTMQDPVLGPTHPGSSIGAGEFGDQSVATVDYDYSKAYGGADTSVVSDAGGTMGENTRDTGSQIAAATAARAALGASFDSGEGGKNPNVKEEVIEISAPAGKLGVVIDTPQFEGPPVVHAVKDSSVIADLIQVGDKLVAVDDENVTNMTAIKVSKLISKKSANPSRKLTVIRTTIIDPEG